MGIQTMALLLAFGLVSFVAIIALRQNRHYARVLKQLQKEPTLNRQTAINEMGVETEKSPEAVVEKDEQVITEDVSGNAQVKQNSSAPQTTANEKPLQATFNVTPRDFIVLTLLAKPERPYTGYELLQALLASGLRFGKMNVFHRYEKNSGQGEILFSLASAVEPGVFELNRMGSFSCPGLTLFLHLPNLQKANKDLLQAFDLMIETARQLADDLGGEVCDEQHQLLKEEKINDWRSYLAYYERSRQIPDLFA